MVLFFSSHRGLLCHVLSDSLSTKGARGENGNSAEIAAGYGEYPKARTKFKRSHPVADEGPAADAEFQLRNGNNKWRVSVSHT